MRSHDRGMSAGTCADSKEFSCSIVEPWNVPNVNYPDTYELPSKLVVLSHS
jgi:hypothetical protein